MPPSVRPSPSSSPSPGPASALSVSAAWPGDALDALDAAREQIREQALFLARLSHEVRRPLSGAFDYDRLLRATPLNAEQSALLDEVTHAGDALLTLLNHVHAYARLGLADVLDPDGEVLVPPSEPVDMVELAESALDHVDAHAREHGLRLALVHEASLPERFTGDAEAVRACLTRVLQHVAPLATGDLTVSVGGTWAETAPAATAGSVPARRVGDLYRLRVDVQAGTDGPVDVAALFAPFSASAPAAGATATATAGGATRSGLELPLARRLAASLGGSLTARSGASTLVVTLDVPMCVDTPPIPASTLLLAGHRAVVVTAHAPTAAMLTRYLERAGIDTHVARPHASGPVTFDGADVVIVDGADPEALALASRAAGPGTKVVQVGGPPAHRPGTFVLPPLVRRAALLDALTDALRAPALSPSGSPDAGHAASHAAEAALPLRVLLVEDNHINQRVAQHLLGRLGVTPDVALNGLEAVERAREVDYDLVLMDVMMPVMDGIEATVRIRQGEGHQPRIVAVTANAMPGDRERCLAVGMDDYLAKPVQLDGLARVLRACRPLAAAAAAPAADILDLPTLRDLRAMIGDDDDAFLDGLVSDYEADAAHLVGDLTAALAAGDIDTARRAAHTLKSSSGMIGARPLSEQAAAIELACDRAPLDDARRAADGIDACLAATRQALSALRATGFTGL